MTTPDDDAFLAAVAAGEKPGGRFAHEDHVRLAWIVLRRDGLARGEERIADLVRHLATALGAPGRYHETVTRAWTRLVAASLSGMPRDASFAQFLAANPALASRDALASHFSPGLLATAEARERWVAPDRAPLASTPFDSLTRARLDVRARRLRTAFLVGAITDALALIPMLIPSMSFILWGFEDPTAPYRFAMGYAASLMLAWTALLLWASRRPLERAFVAPLTVLVIYGLVATELAGVVAGDIARWRMLPTLILQAVLLWLFASAYHGWRIAPSTSHDAASA